MSFFFVKFKVVCCSPLHILSEVATANQLSLVRTGGLTDCLTPDSLSDTTLLRTGTGTLWTPLWLHT